MRGPVSVLMLLVACHDGAALPAPQQVFATPFSTEAAPASESQALAPLPQALALDPQKVQLGAALFRDRRLSGDGAVACSDCHALDQGGAIRQAKSQLPGRKPVPVNVPSIFNMAFDFRFGWAGGYEDIGQQLDFAMTAPAVMHNSWDHAARTLSASAPLRQRFAALYPEGLSGPSLREVLALYALSLITPNARFDRHLRGELQLTPDEKRGYELFRDYGCVSCHQGINVGGNMLQRFGLMRDYFTERGDPQRADLGLFNFSGEERDRHVFRVPSLRNVALTPPYFHDASAATLEQAATIMARYQLGRALTPEQARVIAAFLRSLTGELSGRTQ